MYVVVRGRARFTIAARSSTRRPARSSSCATRPLRRVAIAEEEGTVVLAVGGEPGRAYEVSPWERNFAAIPLLRAERWEQAIVLLEEGLRENPQNSSILYNLACAESRAGRTADAIAHLTEALELNPKNVEDARRDPDFDPIRGEPGFPA